MTPIELKLLRLRLNLSQYQLADLLGVEVLAVSRWENGKRPISKMLILALGKIESDIVEDTDF